MWKKDGERARCIPRLTKGRTEILFIVNTRKTKYVNIINNLFFPDYKILAPYRKYGNY